MKIEVTQTWIESDKNKTGWELEQSWEDEYGGEWEDESVIVTDTDKYGHPIKGYLKC